MIPPPERREQLWAYFDRRETIPLSGRFSHGEVLVPLPPTSLERAFELASSGEFAKISEIRVRLKKEGHDPDQIEGQSVIIQLRALMRKARGQQPPTIAKAYQRNLKF